VCLWMYGLLAMILRYGNFFENLNLDQYLGFDINVWGSNSNLLPFGSSIDKALV
jgi:hypothetical protein